MGINRLRQAPEEFLQPLPTPEGIAGGGDGEKEGDEGENEGAGDPKDTDPGDPDGGDAPKDPPKDDPDKDGG